jgi:hypothetical protein
VQAVEYLLSKCEALSSNPSATKKKQKNKKTKKNLDYQASFMSGFWFRDRGVWNWGWRRK